MRMELIPFSSDTSSRNVLLFSYMNQTTLSFYRLFSCELNFFGIFLASETWLYMHAITQKFKFLLTNQTPLSFKSFGRPSKRHYD